MAILPCMYCQLFVGSLTHKHRTTPPATRPPSSALRPTGHTKSDMGRAYPLSAGTPCMHMCMHSVRCESAWARAMSGFVWPVGLRAEDGGRVAGPRRAGNTCTEGWPCNVRALSTLQAQARAVSLRAKWAWTCGAATAAMDLEGQGVGGGTVATKTAHFSRLSSTRQHN